MAVKLPGFTLWRLRRWAVAKIKTPPSLVIGGPDDPYLTRWHVIPRNRWLNIYLHLFTRDDDDRALHDHPWVNCSILLHGHYGEHTIARGGIERCTSRQPGDIVFRRPGAAHRITLPGWVSTKTCQGGKYPAISLFITGPRVREWGFHCPKAGWVHWKAFTAGPKGETVGKGCDQ